MISWLSIVLIVAVFAFSIWIIYRYAAKTTPYHIYVFVFLGYFFSFFVVVVLPFDAYDAISGQSNGSLVDMWSVVYWVSFALCWFLLPMMKEVEMAGEGSFLGKLGRAFYRCIRFYIVMAVFAIIIVIYIAATDPSLFNDAYAFLIVFGNVFGLFQIIIFLGYGLVEVPRTLWNRGDRYGWLDRMYVKAIFIDETAYNARQKLEDSVRLVCAAQAKCRNTSKEKDFLETVIAKCPPEMVDKHKRMGTGRDDRIQKQLGELSFKRLAQIHRQFKQQYAEYYRAKFRSKKHLEKTYKQMDVVENIDNTNHKIESPLWKLHEAQGHKWGAQRDTWDWWYHTRIKPVLCRIFAIMFAGLSLLVFLCECTLFTQVPVGVLPLLYNNDYGSFGTQILVLLPLLYVCLCTYLAIFSMKLPGFYGLYDNNQTDPSNLAWSAFFLTRLITPLCYNYLLMIKVTGTYFDDVMGVIDLVPVIGQDFAVFFPLSIIFFVFMNLFNVYGKILTMVGLGNYSYSSSGYAVEKLQEGASLVKKHRRKKETKVAGAIGATGQRTGAGGYSGKYGKFIDEPSPDANVNPGSTDYTANRNSSQQDAPQQAAYQPPPSIPVLERRSQSGVEREQANRQSNPSSAPRQASQQIKPTTANRGSRKQQPQRQSYHDRIQNRFGGNNIQV